MAWNLVDVRDTAQLHRLCLEHPGVGNGSRYISAATDSSGLMATHELQAMLAEQFPQLDVAGEEKNEDGGYPKTPRCAETFNYPFLTDFSRFFPVFPGTSGCVLWIPGVQTLKMGEKWGKMGKKWVKKIITGVQKTVLMHASARLEPATPFARA